MMRSTIVLCAAALLLGLGSPVLAQGNPLRDAYFGETHVHTSYSLDAWMFGNRITDPGDAYKYFKGETIKHPLGFDIKIDTPLDFAGVTDHSEYVGVVKLANESGSAISKMPAAAAAHTQEQQPGRSYREFTSTSLNCWPAHQIKALMSPEIAHTVWEENIKFANKANEPGKFTAFCSYEWTSMPNNMNLHRNVFFKDCARVPAAPFSALDSADPYRPLEMDGRSAQGGATTCWRSRTMPTSRTGACIRPRSISMDGRSTGPMRKTGCATSR